MTPPRLLNQGVFAMVRHLLALTLALSIAAGALAAEGGLTPLFDFESGLTGWWANPWSGGKAFAEPAPSAKFGQGALQVRYEAIPQSGNVICPEFPADAPWRAGDYDRLVLWLKGDGTQASLTVILESGAGEKPLTFSRSVPLDSTKWRRFSLKFDTFWNREGQRFDLRQFRRLYFGSGGTHTAQLDGLSLQSPLLELPLAPQDHGGPAAIEPQAFMDREGRFFLTFDPGQVLEPTVTVDLTVQWPGGRGEKLMRTIAALAATGEAWLTLPGLPGLEGDARLSLQLKEPTGVLCYKGQFIFPVTLPAQGPGQTPLALVPQPKQTTFHPGKWTIPAKLEVRLLAAPDMAQPGARRLAEEAQRWLGRETKLLNRTLRPQAPAFVSLGAPGEPPDISTEVRDRVAKGLPAQGYVLEVGEAGMILAAGDEAGMRYAALTAVQLLRSATTGAEGLQVPAVTVSDWPSLPIRAVNFGLPTTRWGHPNNAPVPLAFFRDFLQRTVIDLKYNVVVLEVLNGMKYEKYPDLAGPAAWSKAEVRELVQFLKTNGVEVIPLVECLGHASWMNITHPELAESGDTNTICSRHPETRPFLTAVLDEVLEVFEPRYLHVGLDEVRWPDGDPKAKPCPRCQGTPRWKLFLEQTKWLDEYARGRDVRPLMWSDMVIAAHGGGPPFNVVNALDELPTDIIQCDWSASLDPLSLWDLHDRGFTVWKSNSRGANRLQHRWLAGNMWGVWSRVAWLTEAGWPALGYSYLNLPVAAEYAWNPYPDVMANEVPLAPEYFTSRPLLQRTLAAQPETPGAPELTYAEPGPAKLKLAGLNLQPFATPTVASRTFALGQPVAAVYALLAADLPADQAGAFRELFKQAENWYGIPVGELTFTYADGLTARLPLQYGVHLRAVAPQDPFPQAWGTLGQAVVGQGEGARTAYLVQWPNPRPEVAVQSVTFTPGQQAARPVLCGLAWRAGK